MIGTARRDETTVQAESAHDEPMLADSVRLTDEGVLVLDRRVFPFEHRWVLARTVSEVATAITDMVTQSSGPYFAALWAMVLAAREPHRDTRCARRRLREAAAQLVAARPTNDHQRIAVSWVLGAVDALDDDVDAAAWQDVVIRAAQAGAADYRQRSRALGEATAALLPDHGTVLTHCWGDLYLIATVAAARRRAAELRFVCTETRPYLQGARLTADTLAEMGVDTTVITDGMGASVLASGQIDVLVTATDRVTADGHVINKVGTLGLALAAHAYGVPYYALAHGPDPHAVTGSDVPIEHRDGDDVLHTLGRRTASTRVRGHYPAFDITPPRLVTRIVTDQGAFTPDQVHRYRHDRGDFS